jgi:cytokinin dehydrogenase
MARCLVFMLLFLISSLISTVGLPVEPPAELLQLGDDVGRLISVDASDVQEASRDFGGVARAEPAAVFQPRGAGDVAGLVRAAHGSARGFPVSARGHGHSISGQAQVAGGVVVDMSHGPGGAAARARALPAYSAALGGHYVDVWGGELWVDVLNWTLSHGGLAPRSWTDYLYLSVGGTLSNAGISGQAFHHGPQISNVYELDVVTGACWPFLANPSLSIHPSILYLGYPELPGRLVASSCKRALWIARLTHVRCALAWQARARW